MIEPMDNKAESSAEAAMKRGILFTLAVASTFVIAPAQVSAHHGSANYDMSKSVSVKGTVKQFAFVNPHSAIYLEAKDDKGNSEEWLVEADSPNNLARAGWNRESIKA
jgi:hypothetical protein